VSSIAIAPLAPGRLSTTTDLPRRSVSGGAMMRAMTSSPPPGAVGVSKRIGRAGKSCASAMLAASISNRAAGARHCVIPLKRVLLDVPARRA